LKEALPLPFVEILAPPLSSDRRQAVTDTVTTALADAFAVGAATLTLYFLDVPHANYAHAGQVAPDEPPRLFIKVHAYRRGTVERRAAAAALTPVAALYGVPEQAIVVYFFDREQDEVAHGGILSCDA
jgi:phenylpyruvate tautomerase PptA (4-oxalocrotonate tautomerase family)